METFSAMSADDMARIIRMCDPFGSEGLYLMESYERGAKNDKLSIADAVECVLG